MDLKGSRLLLSRNTWVVTLVLPKAAYPFESFAIASMWAGDDRVLVANAIPDSGMVRVSGLMLNVNDRYLINNLDVQALPPLTALKQTLMILWQKQEEAYGLSTPELGVSVLILSHGIRQSHITRIPMADVSVCFLTFDILNKVVPHWMHRFRNMGIINCSQPQIDLFRSFFDAFRQQVRASALRSISPTWAGQPGPNPRQ